MIAPLRRRHRLIFAVMLVGLPALFVLALMSRSKTPEPSALPAALLEGRVPLGSQPDGPDPLLYWSSDEVEVGDELPKDARLLGAVRSGDWLSDSSAPPAGGTLFVYSLLDQEIVELLELSITKGVQQ